MSSRGKQTPLAAFRALGRGPLGKREKALPLPPRASPYAVNWPNADGDPHRAVRQPAQLLRGTDSLSRSAIRKCEQTHTDHGKRFSKVT
jgi:hypothetical protein